MAALVAPFAMGGPMTLDPGKVQALVDLVNLDIPNWTGFSDERFIKEERSYKLATRARAVGPEGLLSEETLGQLIADNAFQAVIKNIEAIGRDNNLLYNAQPMYGDMNILYVEELDKAAFSRAFFDLLWGPGDGAERLGRYVSFVSDRGLPLKWTFSTYFLYICHDGEMFVKNEATKWFLGQLGADAGIGDGPSAERYAAVKATMQEVGEVLGALGYPPTDSVDLQSFLWTAYSSNRVLAKAPVKPDSRAEFVQLFERFVPDYAESPVGLQHREMYPSVRATGRANYEAIVAAQDRGDDVTDRVLKQLLPHSDTQTHRDGGYWIHVAPAINGDIRGWFEAAGLQTAESLLDRLINTSHQILMDGSSYRPRKRPRPAGQATS